MDHATASEPLLVGPLLTVKVVADSLNVELDTVYRMIARGKMGHHRVGGRGRGAIRVSLDQLRAYLTSCESGLAEDPPPFRKAAPRPGSFSHLPPS